jgi:hypothetical protein
MEGSVGYLAQLEAVLGKKVQYLEATQIPRLRDALSSYDALFEGAMAMLIRKGLLREDPYNYEQVFTEIAIPSDETLPEFENSDEVSYRLAAFRRQLKYLCGEYPLDLEVLNLAKLKKMSSLVAYINWLEFGEASKSPTTRAFARAFMKVRMSSDTMASQILKDSETQIVKNMHVIRGVIGELITFYRESWKADLRRIVLPALVPSAGETHAHREEMLRGIKRGFAQKMSGKIWYPALTEELADEELAPDGEERKQKVLSALAIAEPAKAKTNVVVEGRTILMDAVRLLSRPHDELGTAVAVLEENERLLREAHVNGGGWLKRLLGGGAGQKSEDRSYKVQYTEPGGNQEIQVETVDFAKLSEEVEKKITVLAALSSGSGPAVHKLESTGEESLAVFVDKQLNELLLIHRRLTGLNTLFQARATQEKKTMRGIKIELLTLKNAIVKANQRRHEYQATGSA